MGAMSASREGTGRPLGAANGSRRNGARPVSGLPVARSRPWGKRLWGALGALVLTIPGVTARAADARGILEQLSQQHGFGLQGVENLAPDDIADDALQGDVAARVRQLLHRYNYLVVSGNGHRIEKVVIIGAKHGAHLVEPANSVKIERDGVHHRVEALLTGINGHAIATTLIIDTGASNVVLPESMMQSLGYRPEDLPQTTSQTASGPVAVKVAKLGAVAVGSNQANDVAVSFVEDSKIGNLRLLGMSFLRHFRVTIDDQDGRLILVDR